MIFRHQGSKVISYSFTPPIFFRRETSEHYNIGKPQEETTIFDEDPSWELEIADFVDKIVNDEPIDSGTSEDTLQVMKLIFAIYEDDHSYMESGNLLWKDHPNRP